MAVAPNQPAEPASPYPDLPARGPGALTVVLDPPVVVPEYQDPAKAVQNIASFIAERRQPGGPTSGPGADLSCRVAELSWYHTIELPHGVVTPGSYDHRPLVPHYGLPETLAGKRAIDIATADGFWAFEMERRGADVTAVDVARLVDHDFPPSVRAAFIAAGVDRPTGAGFALAHEALGSSVQRWEQSIYVLDDAELGKFEQVHVADVLLHLERPLDALRRIHAVTGGQALIPDTIEGGNAPGRHALSRQLGSGYLLAARAGDVGANGCRCWVHLGPSPRPLQPGCHQCPRRNRSVAGIPHRDALDTRRPLAHALGDALLVPRLRARCHHRTGYPPRSHDGYRPKSSQSGQLLTTFERHDVLVEALAPREVCREK